MLFYYFSQKISVLLCYNIYKYIYLQKYGTDMLKNSVKKAGLCQK